MTFNGVLTKRKEHKGNIYTPSNAMRHFSLMPFVLFIIFSTFGDIFLTFHFFWWQGLTTGEESPHFLPNLYVFQVCSQSENHPARNSG